MGAFYLGWEIRQTPSAVFHARMRTEERKVRVATAVLSTGTAAEVFPLPWSHYVRLLSVENLLARAFYEEEAICGSWSVRQLDRQAQALFYERTAVSRNKVAMLTKGAAAKPEDAVTTAEQIRDPLVLEFLNLKDEYSEGDLEEAIIRHLEAFLLELGDAFTFVGRQKRLRIDDKWFHVDLVFFHRVLRCLLVVDLKLGAFTHADAGQMHMYLNYAKEHWVKAGENPPVGLILCAEKGHDEARYALEVLGTRCSPRPTAPPSRTRRCCWPNSTVPAGRWSCGSRTVERGGCLCGSWVDVHDQAHDEVYDQAHDAEIAQGWMMNSRRQSRGGGAARPRQGVAYRRQGEGGPLLRRLSGRVTALLRETIRDRAVNDLDGQVLPRAGAGRRDVCSGWK